MEHKKNIIFIIAIAFCIVFSNNIYNSIESYKYRRLCTEYRKQLDRTTEANKKLADRIGRVTEIVERIAEATNANITDARSIIETIERLRTQIKELENICGGFDYNKYYEYWDSYYGIE